MRRHTNPLRVLLAMMMMLGFLSFSGTYALAGDEVPDGTPSGDGTAVAEPDDTGGSSVSALPETGNGPESDNSGSILMIAAIAAILLVVVAVALRRMRLNES
jgi:amino acid transporter